MIIINDKLSTSESNSYETEQLAIDALIEAFGKDAKCKVVITVVDGKHVPAIKWSDSESFRMVESAKKAFILLINLNK